MNKNVFYDKIVLLFNFIKLKLLYTDRCSRRRYQTSGEKFV